MRGTIHLTEIDEFNSLHVYEDTVEEITSPGKYIYMELDTKACGIETWRLPRKLWDKFAKELRDKK